MIIMHMIQSCHKVNGGNGFLKPKYKEHVKIQERENLESVLLKKFRGSQYDVDLPTDSKDSIDQETSTPIKVQSTLEIVISFEKEASIHFQDDALKILDVAGKIHQAFPFQQA